jgi:NAD(P)-dependent dehydrogenase (short-subunit alcohol dehydrogenase family)
MLLQNKTAVIYGGGGAIGSAVAKDFAREGATVFLAGRTLASLDAVAKEIAAGGGRAETAQVNALDERAVERHIEEVTRKAGGIDILFNGIAMEDIQGMLLVDIPLADFVHPIVNAATAQLVTARAVARQMVKKDSGVILTITAGPPEALAYLGGFGPACGAIEGLWRGLAAELGPKGIRVLCLRSAGSPDTPDVQQTFRMHAKAKGVTYDEFLTEVGSTTLLRRLPTRDEVAKVATIMASDRASAMTGTFVSVTCGSRAE